MKWPARLIVAVAVLATVVSCGSSTSPSNSANGGETGEASKSGKQVVRDAMQAALGASSFRMSGQMFETPLDLTILKGVKGVTGSMTLGGQKVEVIAVGRYAYMKASAAYWTQQGPRGRRIAQLAADRWTKFSVRSRWFWRWKDFLDMQSLFYAFRGAAGTMTNKGTTTYDGQSVVKIYDPRHNTLYISATGTPYLVGLVRAFAGSSVSLRFDSWNKPVTLTAPSGTIKLGG